MKINICHNKTKQNKHNNILKKPSILKLQNSKYRSGLNSKREKTMNRNSKTKTKKKETKTKTEWDRERRKPAYDVGLSRRAFVPRKKSGGLLQDPLYKKRGGRKITKAQESEPRIYINNLF